jgi:SAM-dependent methyltransferase
MNKMKKTTSKSTDQKKINRQLSIICNQVAISITRELYRDVRPMEISRNGIKNKKNLIVSELELDIDDTSTVFEKLSTNDNNDYENEPIPIALNYNKSQAKSSAVKDKSLTYGEIVPASFLQILSTISLLEENNKDTNKDNKDNNNNNNNNNNKDVKKSNNSRKESSKTEVNIDNVTNNKVFVDLGCGTGKAVFTSLFEKQRIFKKVWGIELLPELIEVAITAQDKFLEAFNKINNKTKIIDKKNIIKINSLDNKIIEKTNSTKKKIISSKKEKDNENLTLPSIQIVEIIKKIIIDESQLFGGDISNYFLPIEDLAGLLVKRIGIILLIIFILF